MITINEYKMVESLEEAYTLNQKRTNAILGGTHWLKMGSRAINVGIDLSQLGLDQIIENEESFVIGAMTSLRDIETHKGLQSCFGAGIKEAMKHIVGVQLRNTATLGGSLFMRFGFSDVLTLFLALEADVELYKGGVISLEDYSKQAYDNDIIVNVVVKKKKIELKYLSLRSAATDLPTITCAITHSEEGFKAIVGARPKRAVVVSDQSKLGDNPSMKQIEEFAEIVQNSVEFGSNHRANKAYRQHVCGVFVKRGIQGIMEG